MSTLLLRIAAPLQSWGEIAKFERRPTERRPTKSGIIGLVACAIGIRRNEPLDDLRGLRFGVRTDQPGILLRDYHTAKGERDAYVTNRYYLSDAIFLVGLEGDEKLLETIDSAIKRPMFPLCLGRRACPPEGKITLGIRSGKSLIDALKEEPWLANRRTEREVQEPLRLPISVETDTNDSNSFLARDAALSFNQTHRQYGFRRVTERMVTIAPGPWNSFLSELETNHNAMTEWGG
jgi:CRISPR system Cascade subunit CasD